MQAEPHERIIFLKTLRDYFFKDTGVLSLAPYATCECGYCQDPWNDLKWHRITEIYTLARQSFCPTEGLLLTITGQIVASREHIRSTKLENYQKIYDTLMHGMGMDPLPFWMDQPEVSSNPFFGHALERSWMILFDCVKPELTYTCKPGRRKGHLRRESCQCINRKGAGDEGAGSGVPVGTVAFAATF
ncbi:hypothetical protein AA313_de0203388 [Arthrobotrys entomopaga]|nr:hypothetical protein AA313_de0203388 [Arthrobotrys entomopaga]